MGIRSRSSPSRVTGRKNAVPLALVSIAQTMAEIKSLRVPKLHGEISMNRESAFRTRTSPSGVFCMSWMVAFDTISARPPTAASTSGLSASLQ